LLYLRSIYLFFFQAEDGIRDFHVTGVQTCALPISVIRISTHARIYTQPSTLDEAIEFCRILLTPDTCTVVDPGDRHWEIFVDLCAKSAATGNLIQDAWFAALAIESGCEWVTRDRDYR